MAFRLTILGSNSAAPTSTRNSSSQLLDTGYHQFLIDCAEGTQIQLRKFHFSILKINHIFISHLHGDHFFGLIGLMTTSHLLGRKSPLHIYCFPDLKDVIDIQLRASQTSLIYEVEYHFLTAGAHDIIFEDKHILVESLPLDHRIATSGFLFREKEKPRKINKTMLKHYDIPLEAFSKLQAGEDISLEDGRLLRNVELTIPPSPPLSYAYCTDTGYYPPLAALIINVDVLFHESTFMEKDVRLAREKFHSTAKDAAKIANLASVNQLILGHYSSRYKDLAPLLEEAREIFKNSILAEDGNVYFFNRNV